MNEWRSDNVPVGEPVAVLVDHRFAGWACGGKNAIRAREFTKPAIQPRTLWPSWDSVSAEGWPISASAWSTGAGSLLAAFVTDATYEPPEDDSIDENNPTIGWVEPSAATGYQRLLLRNGRWTVEPSLRDVAKGSTGFGDDEEALD